MTSWVCAADEDRSFVADLERALTRRGVSLDGVLVFVVSPESVGSPSCHDALRAALADNARIVPILRRDVAAGSIPPELLPFSRIPLREGDAFAEGLDALIARLGADLRFDAFISYSRHDLARADRLAEGLWRAGKTTWMDRTELLASEKWRNAILGGIEASDHFVFLLSPHSVTSGFCKVEVEHALSRNKRLIPVLLQPVDRSSVPAALAERQWIEPTVPALVAALDTDPEWTRSHTELLRRANTWERQERADACLLRGPELAAAEQWLTAAGQHIRRNPTALQTEFVLASRQGATRRLRRLITGVTTALVISLALGSAAAFFWRQQRIETQRALANAAEAHVEEALGRRAANEALAWASLVPASLTNADRVMRALRIGASFTLLPELDDRHMGAIAWSRDGSRFAFGASDGTVAVWNMADGGAIRLGKADTPFNATQAVQIVFAPGRPMLASQDRSGKVTLWNLEKSSSADLDEGLSVSGGDVGAHFALRWNGDRVLAAAGARACAWLANPAPPKLIRCRPFQERGQFHWSPEGSSLLWISRFGEPHLWDPASDVLVPFGGPRAASGGFSGDGTRVVIGTRDRRLLVYRIADSGAELQTASGQVPNRLRPGEVDMREEEDGDAGRFRIASRIGTVSWSPAGNAIAYLFARTPGFWIGLRDLVLLPGDDAEALAWSPDGAVLARAGTGGDIRLSVPEGDGYADRRVRPVAGKEPAIAWSPSGRWLAVVAEREPLEIWDTRSHPETVLQVRTTYRDAAFAQERVRSFEALTLSADGRSLAARASPSGVGVWALDGSGGETFDVGDGRDVIRVEWAPTGTTLAYAAGDGDLHLRDGGTERRIQGIESPVRLLAWSPRGDRIAWGSGAKIAVWSAEKQTVFFVDGVRDAGGLAWSPDGKRLAIAEVGGEIDIRDARGASVTTLGAHTDRRERVAVEWPRDDVLVHVTGDSDVRIWNPATKSSWGLEYRDSHAWSSRGELAVGGTNEVRFFTPAGASARPDLPVTFTEPNQRVEAVAWSHDGRFLAFGADLGTIQVADVETGARCTLWGHTGPVNSLVWDRIDDSLLSSARDGTVRRWPALWKEQQFRRALRNRGNWIVTPDLVARPAAFRGLPDEGTR